MKTTIKILASIAALFGLLLLLGDTPRVKW